MRFYRYEKTDEITQDQKGHARFHRPIGQKTEDRNNRAEG
jgi:hypothetical protein